MTNNIASDAPFSNAETAMLSALAALMIPAAEKLPAASDAKILPEIIDGLAVNAALVTLALGALDEYSVQETNCAFVELDEQRQREMIGRADILGFLQFFQMTTLTHYYQDDRVMQAIGLDPRPAWPEGYEIDETDWSVLDPVKARGPIWREAPE